MKLSVAIPDSCLSDEKTLEGKTKKISSIARACAIFRVEEINIFKNGGTKNDIFLLIKILKYLETPQYLRKKLYPRSNELKYAGVLAPLKIPSHKPKSDNVKPGDIREGIIVNLKGKQFADVGLEKLVPYRGKEKSGKRLVFQFISSYPDLTVKEILRDEIEEYWGYRVKEKGNLFLFLSQWKGKVLLTSRKGKQLSSSHFSWLRSTDPLLVVFGSPEKGLHEILGGNIHKLQNSKILNFFPNQGTETVRFEEALLGTFSILNLIRSGYL